MSAVRTSAAGRTPIGLSGAHTRTFSTGIRTKADTASTRSRVQRDGWTEDDVRNSLRSSPEFRELSTMTPAKAQDVVRRAYQSVLRRDPDPGAQGYVERVMRDHWTQADVERELRQSPEYRNRR